MGMKEYKFKINEKVKYLDMVGIVIDAKLHETLGAIYLVKYEDGKEAWAFESSLEKVYKMYDLDLIRDNVSGGKGYRYFQVVEYDGNEEKLKEFVKDLNEKANFWISWRIINVKEGLLEQEVDPLE